jgi:nitrite reductase (NO-forming)
MKTIAIAVLVALLALAALVGTTTAVVSADVAQKAKNDAEAATKGAAAPAAHTAAPAAEADGLVSYAGQTAENAEDLAAAREPFPAELPPVPEGNVVDVELTLKDVVVEIAPGVEYTAWGFEGGAPGPAIHVREGQQVRITLTNGGAIPHSIDFHAARIAPDKAFRDVDPGESITYTFEATDPGVFMYHCGTKPVLAHIANGMYGAIVVEPAEKPLPRADREYVLVSSEWYLNGPGIEEPAAYDPLKAHAVMPDWVTWNGYAGQYVAHPLTADPGETVRFWVVAAGPSLDTDFHVVGTIFDRAWVNQDMTQFQTGVQTVGVPAGGGAVFDVKIDEPGLYPFVSHSFASVDMGQVGLLKVGNPQGTGGH